VGKVAILLTFSKKLRFQALFSPPKNSETSGHIKKRVCIDTRPPVVDERSHLGDREADTLLGSRRKSKVIVTLTERKSRYYIILVWEDRKARSVSQAILQGALPMRKRFETVTCDNGKDFRCMRNSQASSRCSGTLAILTTRGSGGPVKTQTDL